MPETMNFEEGEKGWKMMASLIKRVPRSQRVLNHIQQVNKEK